jgi:hypothetical protein
MLIGDGFTGRELIRPQQLEICPLGEPHRNERSPALYRLPRTQSRAFPTLQTVKLHDVAFGPGRAFRRSRAVPAASACLSRHARSQLSASRSPRVRSFGGEECVRALRRDLTGTTSLKSTPTEYRPLPAVASSGVVRATDGQAAKHSRRHWRRSTARIPGARVGCLSGVAGKKGRRLHTDLGCGSKVDLRRRELWNFAMLN